MPMPTSLRLRHSCRLAALVAGLLLLAACGGTPTEPAEAAGGTEADTQPEATSAGTATAGAADGIEAVYAELEGLSGTEREARLLELAEAEGGVLNLYCSMNGEEAEEIPAAFEEATGISVERYRASSQDVMTRIVEEADADATASDATCVNGSEGVVLQREGLLAPLQIQVEGYPDDQVTDTYAWSYINAYAPMWNTNRVAEAEVPQSWEDVFGHDGRIGMEVKAFDWFATLVEDYFMAEKGMTEEEAIQVFRDAAENAVLVDGNSVTGQLLASGEFDMATAYSWIAGDLINDGAPVAWQPPVEPLVARPNVVGILAEAEHPATALAYIEFLLDEGQEILAEHGRTPSNPTVEGGLPEDIEVLSIDLEQMLDEREKWESLYTEVLQSSDSEVISE